jgi:hypothetical protein
MTSPTYRTVIKSVQNPKAQYDAIERYKAEL